MHYWSPRGEPAGGGRDARKGFGVSQVFPISQHGSTYLCVEISEAQRAFRYSPVFFYNLFFKGLFFWVVVSRPVG